jgi:branched-chain amino acid transport system permease protein
MLLDPALLLQTALSGILLGAVYALLAGGLNLVFGVMRIINVAHADLMMLGAYNTYWLFSLLGVNPLLGLLAGMPVLFALGWGLQKFLVSRVVRASELTSLLLTFGISIAIVNIALYAFSGEYRSVAYLSGSVLVGGMALSKVRLVAFAVAFAITAAVYLFLKWHAWGRAIRAVSQHGDLALACGIDVDVVRLGTFGLAAALAGAAGSLISMMYSIYPEMGAAFLLKAFAIIILGGRGSFIGAFLGAILLGLIESYAALWTTATHAEATAYVTLILMLLLKPAGLLGDEE